MEQYNCFVFNFSGAGVNIKAVNDREAAIKFYKGKGRDIKLIDSCYNIDGFEVKFRDMDVYAVRTDDFEDGYYFSVQDYKCYSVIGFKVE